MYEKLLRRAPDCARLLDACCMNRMCVCGVCSSGNTHVFVCAVCIQ